MGIYVEFGLPAGELPVSEPVPEAANVTLCFKPLVSTDGGGSYLWVSGPDHETVVSALAAAETFEIEILDQYTDKTLVRLDWGAQDRTLFDLVAASEGTFLSIRYTGEQWKITAQFPDTDAISAFYEASAAASLSLSVRELDAVDDHGQTGISATQEQTLRKALAEGYFEVPRETTIQELAADLGVSEQAVSERLRRGLTSLVRGSVLAEQFDTGDETDQS